MSKCFKTDCRNSACYGGGHFGVCALHWYRWRDSEEQELVNEIVDLNEENIRLTQLLAEYKKPPEVKKSVMVGQKLSGGGKLDTRPIIVKEPTDEQRKDMVDRFGNKWGQLAVDQKKALNTTILNKPYHLCHLCGEWENELTSGALFGAYYYCCECIPKKDGIRQKIKALYLHYKMLWMIETGRNK